MKKYLIDYLSEINYANAENKNLSVNVYFDNIALKASQNMNPESLNNNEYKLIIY
jgi:hypothetical protein